MSDKNSLERLLEPLLKSDQSELRQLPKIVAKTYISFQIKSETVLEENPFPNEFLQSLKNRVSQLPTGLVLELWKTFLYHLENDVCPDVNTSKAKNMICMTDPLMSTFLRSACLAEQSLPLRIIDKVIEMCLKTQALLVTLLEQLPKVQASLFEVSILLKNCRRVDVKKVNETLKDIGGILTKRKLESLDDDSSLTKIKKTKVSPKDVIPQNVEYLSSIIDELSDKDIFDVAKMLLKKEKMLSSCSGTITEDLRLQIALILTSLKKVHEHLGTNDSSSQFFSHILKDHWINNPNENEAKLTEAAASIKQIIIVKPEKFSVYSINELLKLFELLPLECTRGEFETLLSLVVIWAIISRKSDLLTNGQLVKAFARCLDPTFRTPSILKYIDFWILAPKLSKVEIPSEHETFLEHILKSLSKITMTYQKTVEATSKQTDLFCKPVEDFSDLGEVRMSVILLESVALNLSNKDVSEEKKSSCKVIFDQMSKSMEKGLKDFPDLATPEMKFFAIRSLNAIFDALPDKNDVSKKWLKLAPKFASFCLQSLDNSIVQAPCFKFLTHICDLRSRMKKLEENFVGAIWQKLMEANVKILECSDGRKLIVTLFSINDELALKELLQKTSDAVLRGDDVSNLLQLWTSFVNVSTLALDEDVVSFRRSILMQLCQILLLKLTNYESTDYKKFLIPCLTFEAAILESEKPLLPRESEVLCLINSSTIKLETVLETSDTFDDFSTIWKAVYKILATAFHKRSSYIVVPRIPSILSILRNLLRSLVLAADQTRKVSPTELKDLVLMAHYIDRLCEHIRKQKEDFARVSAYLVADFVDCFQRITIYTPVKANLLNAIHKLLDICDKHSIDMLAGILPVGRKDIFKHITSEYRKYFRYSGKV